MASIVTEVNQLRPATLHPGQTPRDSGRPQNELLAALDQEEFERLAKSLVPVELTPGQRLAEPGRHVEFVYFPVSGLIAVDALAEGGESVQVGIVGREGLAGLCGLMNYVQMPNTVTVQSAGAAFRGRTSAVREEFERAGSLAQAINRFVYGYIVQVSQSVLCNRLHSIDRRLARWLLTCADHLGQDRITITQEQLAQVLGARRSTVTVAAGDLQAAKLIDYRRGRIQIVNRAGLQAASCECYTVVRRAQLHMEIPAMI